MSKSFEKICRMTQNEVKKYVSQRLKETHKEITIADGFVYAQGTFPVLLVAHMDTVHKELPSIIMRAKDKNGNNTISSPYGIGGDDRCGIYMIFEVLREFNCSVLFCEDEEIGTIGAEKFTKHPISKELDFNYIIEFDRKGNNDAVFYDCDNPEFTDFVTREFFEEAYGSYSDISVIAPHLGCAAVNLSCGYYNAHTTKEYVVIQEMQEVIRQSCKLLARTTEADAFEYIESAPTWYQQDLWGVKDDFYADEKYYFVMYADWDGNEMYDEIAAHSVDEAVGKFLTKYSELTYQHIIDIMVDEYYY